MPRSHKDEAFNANSVVEHVDKMVTRATKDSEISGLDFTGSESLKQ